MKRVHKLAVLVVVSLLLVAGVAGCGNRHKHQRECVISAPALSLQAYTAAGSSSGSSSSSGGSRGGSSSSSGGSSSKGSSGSSYGGSKSSGSTGSKGNSSSGVSTSKSSGGSKGSSVPKSTIPRGSSGYTGGKSITRNGRSYTVNHNHYYVPVGQAC